MLKDVERLVPFNMHFEIDMLSLTGYEKESLSLERQYFNKLDRTGPNGYNNLMGQFHQNGKSTGIKTNIL